MRNSKEISEKLRELDNDAHLIFSNLKGEYSFLEGEESIEDVIADGEESKLPMVELINSFTGNVSSVYVYTVLDSSIFYIDDDGDIINTSYRNINGTEELLALIHAMESIKPKKKVFTRLGFSDLVVEDQEMVVCIIDEQGNPLEVDTYIIGYEDEDGNECEEDGKPLNK